MSEKIYKVITVDGKELIEIETPMPSRKARITPGELDKQISDTQERLTELTDARKLIQ